MQYFPLYVDINKRPCTVIGGGKVAFRKIMSLLEAGALVKVISPQAEKEVQKLASSGNIELIERKYRTGDLRGASLAFVATDDPAVGKEASKEAEDLNIFINVADIPDQCSFILPSVARRGDISIAVSTGGKCPAFARALRLRLEDYIDDSYAEALDLFSTIRQRLISAGVNTNKCRDSLNNLINSDILSLIAEGNRSGAVDLAEEILARAMEEHEKNPGDKI